MAGRKKGYKTPDEIREKIQASQLINRLMSHVEADMPIMDASQVNAAKTLLNKILPDLKAIEFDGSMEHEAGDSFMALMKRIDGRTRTK